MRMILFLFVGLMIFGCGGNSIPDEPETTFRDYEPPYREVSFVYHSDYEGVKSAALSSIVVFYTEDNDSLYLNKEWVRAIKAKMKNMSSAYSTVLLFDSKKHTPDVSKYGIQFPDRFENYMVCGMWNSVRGGTSFCYGGKKPDKSNSFKFCE